MVNKVILIGNVGKDVEVQEVGTTKVAKFSLATSESYTKNGEKVTNTEWHNITIWGKLADVCEKYVKKGDKLFLEGKIQYREYEKDGVKKYFTEINAYSMQMLGGQKKEDSF